MAVPTRKQIQEKIDSLKSQGSTNLSSDLSGWLDDQSCPSSDKTKILDDLYSYPNYP